MARGLVAIVEMKRRLASQPPITIGCNMVSSSTTDTHPHVQRMLLRSATYVRDADMEITSICSKFFAKDRMIAEAAIKFQNLNSSVIALQAKQTSLEGEIKTLKTS
ncbi:hypothetical protein AHAS_Ahas03G0249200 [Arachis hypogaea]